MKVTEIERSGKNGFAFYNIPALCRTARGTLLAAYECRLSLSDWDTRGIGMKRSTDGGATWSKRVMLAQSPDVAVNNPVFISCRDGTVRFLYQLNYERTFIRLSRSDGLTFGEPVEITRGFDGLQKYFPFNVCAIGPGHGAELDSGRLIVGVWLANSPLRQHAPSISGAILSDDGGKNWRAAAAFFPGPASADMVNASETTVAQMPDGRILMNLRHEGPTRCRAFSVAQKGDFDWSEVRYQPDLPDPTCCASLNRAGNRLIFTNCADENARVNLTLKSSYDNGASWGDPVPIWRNAGYSDVCASPDGKEIGCLFEHDSDAGLLFAAL